MSDQVSMSPMGADVGEVEAGGSLASDAWKALRSNPIFWVSAALITLFVVMSIFPGLFTDKDPRAGNLALSLDPPSDGSIFGHDRQGYDIYARTVYGARSSILVGVLTTLATMLVGVTAGVLSGYFGGWVDMLISRITDIFFAIPLLLGALLFLSTFPNSSSTPYIVVVLKVVFALAVLGWPSNTRLMRSSVLQVKPQEYVQAARALGATPWRIIRSHILPNALAPAIVVATINLGVFIVVEATLSFLGIGLTPPAISWGVAISDALSAIRTYPHVLFFPSLFLSLAVLAFILLGDAVRDAFDPKSR